MAGQDLTEGPVWRALARVSAPMSLGILGVLSVGLADAFFLGQLGKNPLAAVGYIYPVTTAVTSLAIGLSAGANAAVSQAIGEGAKSTDRLALHSVGLGLVLSVPISIMFFVLAQYIFAIMGAGDEVLQETAKYIPFWAASFPLLVVMMVTNAIFRANGDGATSAAIMLLAAALNIAVNPLLIFGFGPIPALGTEGAALATLVGRAVAAIVAVWWAFRVGALCWPEDVLKNVASSLKIILQVGAPASLSNAINPAGMALVTAAVATLGDAAVAGFGAATRVQSFVLVPLLALSAGIGPVVGQNWGADESGRAGQALGLCWMISAVYGTVIAFILLVFADPISAIFTESSQTAHFTAQYLQWVSWSLMGYGVLVTTNAAMNAISRPLYSMGLSLARIFAVYMPLAWAGVLVFGYSGILGAAIIANLLAISGAWWCARRAPLIPDISIRWGG